MIKRKIKHIPIRKLKSNSEDLQPYLDKKIVTICPGGGMSLIAVDLMTEAGFQDVKSLHGGLDLRIEKEYPTTIISYNLDETRDKFGNCSRCVCCTDCLVCMEVV